MTKWRQVTNRYPLRHMCDRNYETGVPVLFVISRASEYGYICYFRVAHMTYHFIYKLKVKGYVHQHHSKSPTPELYYRCIDFCCFLIFLKISVYVNVRYLFCLYLIYDYPFVCLLFVLLFASSCTSTKCNQ